MSTITSFTHPAGTAIDAPEVEHDVSKLVRAMPKNMGFSYLITVSVFANRTEVRRHAETRGPDALLNVQAEPTYGRSSGLLHWRLAAASEHYDPATVARLRALEF